MLDTIVSYYLSKEEGNGGKIERESGTFESFLSHEFSVSK
jgi:hypothetical protein